MPRSTRDTLAEHSVSKWCAVSNTPHSQSGENMRSLTTIFMLLLAAIAIQRFSPQQKPLSGPAGPARHTSGPMGDEWLTWSRVVQTAYLRGYYEGHQLGDLTGCLDTSEFFAARGGVPTNMAMPSEPALNCQSVMLRWSRSSDSIADAITQYYQSYPTDYIVPVPLVMNSLSDQKRMTFLQVHHYYVEGTL